jgi:TRAF3-interacting protein 1
LRKPPFRFLHHIITSVLKSTGIPAGLIPESELRSKNVTTKAQKTAFLDRIVAFINLASNSGAGGGGVEPLNVRASKVLAGLEPERTNDLLAALARCALRADEIDSVAIANQVHAARGETVSAV